MSVLNDKTYQVSTSNYKETIPLTEKVLHKLNPYILKKNEGLTR